MLQSQGTIPAAAVSTSSAYGLPRTASRNGGLASEKTSKIYVAGHRGLVGGTIVRRLEEGGYTQLVLRSRSDLDLRDAPAVERFFAAERPTHVFLAAAKVGGIRANDAFQAELLDRAGSRRSAGRRGSGSCSSRATISSFSLWA